MDTNTTVQTIVSLLRSTGDITKIGEITGGAFGKQTEKSENTHASRTDSLSVRFGNLASAHLNLKQTHEAVAIEQTKYSIAQSVRDSLGSIQSHLDDIERLAVSVSEGDMTEEQVNDVQIMIESHLARIDDIASGTTWSGQSLLTGENIRFTTDSISNAGFDVNYPEADTASLEIDDLNVISMDADAVSSAISNAQTLIESHLADADLQVSSIESSLESRISDFRASFSDLRSSERLNTSPETRWLVSEDLRNSMYALDLNALTSGTGLDAGVVSTLLR